MLVKVIKATHIANKFQQQNNDSDMNINYKTGLCLQCLTYFYPYENIVLECKTDVS